ncbi:TPA: hypothetical protein JI043_04360 [Acinetobacter baumannii]|nr:hypothetical protein RR09_07890 [Acinetobacter baumannii]KKD19531.1 hypothetical protein MRSN16897_08235 [Acinetobacter baumannii]KKD28502.1 hypothetical protein MRSN16875_07475 [Acinetobacter baumannii]KRR72471.1 hypothetical protein AQ975_08280 [Acinetobacter baumannii]KRR75035.1 hypothetical protein AQ976_07290 [Acinetobacter baumannii]
MQYVPFCFVQYKELRSSIENLVQKYKHDAHASSLFGDQDKARVYNCFANQLKNLLKGGA